MRRLAAGLLVIAVIAALRFDPAPAPHGAQRVDRFANPLFDATLSLASYLRWEPERLFAQAISRRLTTIEAARTFPVYYHLQTVVLRGEFIERGRELVLAADEQFLRLLNPAEAKKGAVEVRGQIIDVGKLERSDPRLGTYAERFKDQEWPRAGAEVVLSITNVQEAEFAAQPSVRALALEPWKFEGQKVTVAGMFRGRNLFGDLPEAPGRSRYDFVLTGIEGAIWVTELQPRGRGFDLNVERRNDSGRWLEVTGVVERHRGLALLKGASVVETKAPAVTAAEPEPAPAPAPPTLPLTVVFSDPSVDETGVPTTTSVRVQFSRGLLEASIKGQVRVTYVDGTKGPIPFKTSYDGATRALRIDFDAPLEPFRTVRVELLDAIRAFDKAPFEPWTLTFSTAGE